MRLSCFLLVCALSAPAPLIAQAQPMTFFGAGITLPTGEVDQSHGRGYSLGTQFSWPLKSYFAVLGSLHYRDVRRDDDATVQRLQDEGQARWGATNEFWLGGGFLDGGHRSSLAGLVHAQLLLRPGAGRLTYYLLAGGGLARTALGSLHVYFLNETDDYEGESEFVGALDFGGGLSVQLGQSVGLFAQATHLTLMTDGASTSMVPIQIGLSFITSDRFVR
jgi:hypothetical protein